MLLDFMATAGLQRPGWRSGPTSRSIRSSWPAAGPRSYADRGGIESGEGPFHLFPGTVDRSGFAWKPAASVRNSREGTRDRVTDRWSVESSDRASHLRRIAAASAFLVLSPV